MKPQKIYSITIGLVAYIIISQDVYKRQTLLIVIVLLPLSFVLNKYGVLASNSPDVASVSYTHLDVYKRQLLCHIGRSRCFMPLEHR